MFTDIEGFSRISEDIAPELLTSRLSRYFEALGAAIAANRGMIDKYIGDSVMAFWNAPEPDTDHVFHACRAALQAAAAGRSLADKWRSAAGRASAPASDCMRDRRWSAMSARATASTTRWSARSPTRPRGSKG